VTQPLYLDYFGLKEIPFSIAPDPTYLFMSDRHREALAHLLYGVGTGGGFVLLTGEVGTGKTTISRHLMAQMGDDTDIALILNPRLEPIELLANVCDELEIGYSDNPTLKELNDKLSAKLVENHQQGRHTLLMIDEAQHLSFDVLEQIRLLTNLETNTRKLLQIILIGQPELFQLVNRQELRQLAQRITARYHLMPLSYKETQAYINHRLQVAGLPGHAQLFTDSAIKLVHKFSQGIPRLINVICDRSLLGIYSQQGNRVKPKIVRQAASETAGVQAEVVDKYSKHHWQWGAGVFACFSAVFWWYMFGTLSSEKNTIQQVVASKTQQEIYTFDRHSSKSLAALDYIWGFADGTSSNLCKQKRSSDFACEKQQVSDWQQVQQINRPGVLRFVDEQRNPFYLPVLRLDSETVTFLVEQREVTVTKADVAPFWSGEFSYVWRKPQGMSLPIASGQAGPMVEWVKEKLWIEGFYFDEVNNVYDQNLVEAVKAFQQQHELQVDGLIGQKTLMFLLASQSMSPTLI